MLLQLDGLLSCNQRIKHLYNFEMMSCKAVICTKNALPDFRSAHSNFLVYNFVCSTSSSSLDRFGDTETHKLINTFGRLSLLKDNLTNITEQRFFSRIELTFC